MSTASSTFEALIALVFVIWIALILVLLGVSVSIMSGWAPVLFLAAVALSIPLIMLSGGNWKGRAP